MRAFRGIKLHKQSSCTKQSSWLDFLPGTSRTNVMTVHACRLSCIACRRTPRLPRWPRMRRTLSMPGNTCVQHMRRMRRMRGLQLTRHDVPWRAGCATAFHDAPWRAGWPPAARPAWATSAKCDEVRAAPRGRNAAAARGTERASWLRRAASLLHRTARHG